MNTRIHGYADGERVRDRRDGTTGTVRHLDLTVEERACGDVAEAEIVWDGLAVQSELALELPYIERLGGK